MELVVKQAKKRCVSYCRIHLSNVVDMEKDKSNLSPLLALVFSEVGRNSDGFGSGMNSGVMCPVGFLDEFFRDSDYDTLDPILKQLYEDLSGSVLKVSPLGNFQQPLKALLYLCSFSVGAKSLVNHPWWVPKGVYLDGRVIEMTTILGPFFHVNALPDLTIFKCLPDVGEQCFSEVSNRRPADLLSSFTTIKTVMNNLYDGLAEVLLCLLKNADTLECVLEYLAEVINSNASRAHMQVDPVTCASLGMFVNLGAVMLRLCEPFLDVNLTKRDKIDPNYVFYGTRLDLKALTALHASSEEVTEWLNKRDAMKIDGGNPFLLLKEDLASLQNIKPMSSCSGKPKCTFISECFFMTARVLNLGILKAFSDYKHRVQDISYFEIGRHPIHFKSHARANVVPPARSGCSSLGETVILKKSSAMKLSYSGMGSLFSLHSLSTG